MPAFWYVLRSKPRKEDALSQQVKSQGYAVYYPRIPVQAVNPRARKVAPYFPGYMFVHVDLDEVGISTFQWMPYAHGLICFDDVPAAVPDDLVESIHKRVSAIAAAGGELFLGLARGDAVVIKSGPFAGYEAIFDTRLSGAERVRVFLTMLGDREIPVELAEGQLRRKG